MERFETKKPNPTPQAPPAPKSQAGEAADKPEPRPTFTDFASI